MDNNFNQQPVYQQAPKQSGINVMELVAIICSAVGLFMAVLGTILTCSCSASKSFDYERTSDGTYVMSAVFIVTIIGIIIAITGVVFAIIAMNQKNAAVKAGKMAMVSFVVGIFAVFYGLIPTFTICGYNCALESAMEDMNGVDKGGMNNMDNYLGGDLSGLLGGF